MIYLLNILIINLFVKYNKDKIAFTMMIIKININVSVWNVANKLGPNGTFFPYKSKVNGLAMDLRSTLCIFNLVIKKCMLVECVDIYLYPYLL